MSYFNLKFRVDFLGHVKTVITFYFLLYRYCNSFPFKINGSYIITRVKLFNAPLSYILNKDNPENIGETRFYITYAPRVVIHADWLTHCKIDSAEFDWHLTVA